MKRTKIEPEVVNIEDDEKKDEKLNNLMTKIKGNYQQYIIHIFKLICVVASDNSSWWAKKTANLATYK
jgi:hypothetical protein